MAVTPKPPPSDLDAEALFEEARRLRRRRWLAAGAVVLAAAAAAGVSYLAAGTGGSGHPAAPAGHPAPARVPRGRGPVTDAKAFGGHGILAFVSQGTLWVLDGSRGSVRQASHGGGA